jgi:hypothetical protein
MSGLMATPNSLQSLASDPNTVVNTAFLLYRSKKEISLVLEGPTDKRFWGRFIQMDCCRVEILGNKSNVLEASKLIDSLMRRFPNYAQSGPFALAVADLDYDYVHSRTRTSPSIRYVQICPATGHARDIEIVMLRSRALYDYLLQEDLEAQTEQIRNRLFEEGAKIGSLRFLASAPGLSRSPFGEMKALPWSVFFNAEDLSVDLQRLATSLGRGEHLLDADIAEYVRQAEAVQAKYSKAELCRGHDLTQMLARHLEHQFPQRHYNAIDVEKGIRLAFGIIYAQNEAIYREIKEWGLTHDKEVVRPTNFPNTP